MSGADGEAGAVTVAMSKAWSSADGNSLDAKYANLKGESSETQLYTMPSTLCKQEVTTHEAEICDVLGRAFSRLLVYAGAGDARDSNALIEEVAEKACFRVTGVVVVLSSAACICNLQRATRSGRRALHSTALHIRTRS